MSLAGLVRFSLTQRLLMLLLVALLLPAGWWAIQTIPIDAFPDISPTQVKIIMKAPGMTPEEVESRITRLIEVELLGVQRQTMLRSVAKYALTDITVDFEEGTDIYWARQQVAGGFEPRTVDVRSTGSGAWIVLDGLAAGERVAVTGTAVLKGMSVGMGGGDG